MPFTDSVKMVDVIIADTVSLNTAPSDVLQGKEFIGAAKQVETGSMPKLETKSDFTIVAGESRTIAYGYNPAAYTITAQDLASQTIGDATSGEILNTKTAWVNGVKVTGNMPNIGSETATLACSETHTISKGYHDGTGIISARSLAEQTQTDITSDKILYGELAYANGNQMYGTMPNNGTVYPDSIAAGESYTIPLGYHSGAGIVTAKDLASQTAGTATANEIVEDSTAWVDGVKVTGTMNKNSAETIMLSANGTYNIPYGYHTGQGKVTQNIPSQEAITVAPDKEAQVVEVAGYYMSGNITVSGVDALNYQYDTTTILNDTSGNPISNYTLSVSGNTAIVNIYTDNWHDNATTNTYKITFTDLIDSSSESVNLSILGFIDKGSAFTYTMGSIGVTLGFNTTDHCQFLKVDGLTSGKVTMTNYLNLREYGA